MSSQTIAAITALITAVAGLATALGVGVHSKNNRIMIKNQRKHAKTPAPVSRETPETGVS